MTAATPTRMPRIVRAARSLLAAVATMAVRSVSKIGISVRRGRRRAAPRSRQRWLAVVGPPDLIGQGVEDDPPVEQVDLAVGEVGDPRIVGHDDHRPARSRAGARTGA